MHISEQPNETNIRVLWPRDDLVIAEIDRSYIRGTYHPDKRTLYLTDMFVPPVERRRGIATALVTTIRDALTAEGGRRMIGDISSTPCADVMRRVLGDEAVHSVVEGGYVFDDPDFVPPAMAILDYTIEPPVEVVSLLPPSK
ncbi:MAG TPA: GNAT family N-acetyltransferase [Candidatus Saccharimonadales bacterium]|nr:GNAT family N-acetyltransferase [Candidatus Saccharimonadales bacterium]